MKEVILQIRTIWKEMKRIHKAFVLTTLIGMALMLSYAALHRSEARYLPLALAHAEPSSIRHYLEHHLIPFKEHPEKGILVPEEQLDRVRAELTASGYVKQEQGKGFELFDTNTWIKGDKELQVLEMRALKGQIEHDLANFDPIKSANVILDIAPSKTLSSPYKTKASVIVKLMPHALLSPSQLMAITYHLTGAVRGLEPNMIAISDTTGKLYKAIDPEGKEEDWASPALIFEERLEQKLQALLLPTIGADHFVITVQASLDKGETTPHALSLVLLIDPTYEALIPSLQTQIGTLTSGYAIPCQIAVQAVPFDNQKTVKMELGESSPYGKWFVFAMVILLVLCGLYPLFRRYYNKREEEKLCQVMTRVDLNRLAASMQGEDPDTIALLLSYLEPARAEEMLAAFPKSKQEEVLFYLNELEQEI